MNSITPFEKIKLIDKLLKPATPAEFERTLPLAFDPSVTLVHIEAWVTEDFWRTKSTELRGHRFCAECTQILPKTYCRECGLPDPGTLPTFFDALPRVSASRDWEMLSCLADLLLPKRIPPKFVLKTLNELNTQHFRPKFAPEQIAQIFNDAGAREIARRRGVA